MKSPSHKLPIVAIAGRPNVGKSTLFNRLVEKRKAIVQRESGTTRDRIYQNISWRGKHFTLVDTGGFQFAGKNTLEQKVDQEVTKALKEAEIILFVVDGEEGLTNSDDRFAHEIRGLNKKNVILTVNKEDVKSTALQSSEFYRLGFSKLLLISAAHGTGIGELLDEIVTLLPKALEAEPQNPYLFSLTIVGEPNVGKSTYLNKLLNEERVIVSPIPGTTRDIIEESFELGDKHIRLVDTAGLRANKKIKSATELFSFSRTREALACSDIIVLLFDANQGLRRDSKRVLDEIIKAKKGLIFVANKWDIAKDREWGKYQKDFYRIMNYINHYPLFSMSGLTGKNILKPIEESFKIYKHYSRKFSTRELNVFLDSIKRKAPPQGGKLKYFVQTGSSPLRFSLFLKNKEKVPDHYWNFFENQFIEYFELSGVGIYLNLKEEEKKDD